MLQVEGHVISMFEQAEDYDYAEVAKIIDALYESKQNKLVIKPLIVLLEAAQQFLGVTSIQPHFIEQRKAKNDEELRGDINNIYQALLKTSQYIYDKHAHYDADEQVILQAGLHYVLKLIVNRLKQLKENHDRYFVMVNNKPEFRRLLCQLADNQSQA